MIGGPNVIGMCDEDKLHFLERRFTEHYETLQDSEDVRESVPAIAFGGVDMLPALKDGDSLYRRSMSRTEKDI
jgi:hypothetical protein